MRGELITVEVVPTTAQSKPGTPGWVVVVVVFVAGSVVVDVAGGGTPEAGAVVAVPPGLGEPVDPGGAVVPVVPNGSDPPDLAEVEQVNPFNIPVPGGTVTATHVAPKSVV